MQPMSLIPMAVLAVNLVMRQRQGMGRTPTIGLILRLKLTPCKMAAMGERKTPTPSVTVSLRPHIPQVGAALAVMEH